MLAISFICDQAAMEWRVTLLLAAVFCGALFQASSAARPFRTDPIPTFNLGDRYPDRDEDDQCTPIKLRLPRDSKGFAASLVRNTNPLLNFVNEDARFMTFRLKARLDILAAWYNNAYGSRTVTVRLTVILSYVEPTAVTDRIDSLHYEGNFIPSRVEMLMNKKGGSSSPVTASGHQPGS